MTNKERSMSRSTAKPGLPSEAEMLSASEDDYMSPTQLAFFRQRLLDEEAALRGAAEETTHHLQETAAEPDPNDRASAEEEHALELRVRDRERKLLKKIAQALKRIDDGSYGWCEDTGEPIGIARLLARPTASLCLEAQERHEQRRRQFGG
jgi:DnaK suppressor protein